MERHNLVIADMLDRFLEESNIDISLALSWCVNTENSLANVHGFSSLQLTLGQFQIFPQLSLINPQHIYKQKQVRYLLTDNLTALHRAREAFLASKNSEKIY